MPNNNFLFFSVTGRGRRTKGRGNGGLEVAAQLETEDEADLDGDDMLSRAGSFADLTQWLEEELPAGKTEQLIFFQSRQRDNV